MSKKKKAVKERVQEKPNPVADAIDDFENAHVEASNAVAVLEKIAYTTANGIAGEGQNYDVLFWQGVRDITDRIQADLTRMENARETIVDALRAKEGTR
jgi:hypothetical protein